MGLINSLGCMVIEVAGIAIQRCAPNFVIPKNSTANNKAMPSQYKNGIIPKLFLIGKINTNKNAAKDIEKYINCLLAKMTFVSLIK